MCEDLKFKHPFTCIISGLSGSGRSSFSIKLLQNLVSLYTETKFDGGILWCYGKSNAVPSVDVGGKYSFTNVCQTISRTLVINRVSYSSTIY